MDIAKTIQWFARFGQWGGILWNACMLLTVIAGLLLGARLCLFFHRNHTMDFDEDTMLQIRRRAKWREEHKEELKQEILQERVEEEQENLSTEGEEDEQEMDGSIHGEGEGKENAGTTEQIAKDSKVRAHVKSMEERLAERPAVSWMEMHASAIGEEYGLQLADRRSEEDHAYEIMKRKTGEEDADGEG